MAKPKSREMLVRVTRHPLTTDEIADLTARDSLPPDYQSRSVEATDFVKVNARDDAEAAMEAMKATSLVFGHERVTLDEVEPENEYRPLGVVANAANRSAIEEGL